MRQSFVCATGAMAVVCGGAVANPAVNGEWRFTVDSMSSGLSGLIETSAETAGTLIGDWDPVNNPGGTRTKPGIFGSFGDDENVAVPVSLGFGVGDDVTSRTGGTFDIRFRPALGTGAVTNLAIDYLSGGSLALPATLRLDPETFRTRNPDSLFPGVEIEVPIGELTVSRLFATQTGPAAPGVLSDLGGGVFSFVSLVPVDLELGLSFLGNDMPPTVMPAFVPIGGEVMVSGSDLVISSVQPLMFAQVDEPGTALPQFALPLPTVLPPGGTANVLMDLVLDRVEMAVDAELRLNATATPIPGLGGPGVLAAGVLLGARRRR